MALRCLMDEVRREGITGPRSVGFSAPHLSGTGLTPCWSGYAIVLVSDVNLTYYRTTGLGIECLMR